MLPDRPRMQVLIGGKDVTDRCDAMTFSATDQGGYEICTLGLPAGDRPRGGAPITIRSGLEVAWFGRTAEVSDHSQHGIATKTTGGEGWVGLMRDNPMQMIYVDRDLTKWSDPSTARQIQLLAASKLLGTNGGAPDPTSSAPCVAQTITGAWASPIEPFCEAWYDAGPGNLIGQLYYDYFPGASVTGGSSWADFIACSADANYTNVLGSANLATGSESAGYIGPASPERFALLQHTYTATPAGNASVPYVVYWRNLAVYGNHGLQGRGSDPNGFYPSDIASHALSQVAGILPGVIVPALSYIAPHVTYPTPTTPDVIVTDMAKLMGWTWGVWEPPSVFSSQPRMDFRPPPTDATCVVSKAECDQLDVTARLGDLYSTAEVTYTDAAGTAGMATVTLANPQLQELGIGGRTLLLDIGLGSQAAAAAFGSFALALSQVSARAAGQATLPACVRLAGGGSKPAHLIRPGIDRLRILDFSDGGPLLNVGLPRRDTFRVSRIETTIATDGSVSSVAELDSGQNLLETLQARMALAAGVIGQGASG